MTKQRESSFLYDRSKGEVVWLGAALRS